MKSIYLLIAITLILLGCEDVAAPSDNSLGGQIPSATDINDLNNEGAILQGQIVDTISNSLGEIEIHIKDYELVSDKSTGEIDTVFAEDSLVYTEAEWDEEVGEDVKLESPITRWKKLIGDKDPAVATTEEGLPGTKVMN